MAWRVRRTPHTTIALDILFAKEKLRKMPTHLLQAKVDHLYMKIRDKRTSNQDFRRYGMRLMQVSRICRRTSPHVMEALNAVQRLVITLTIKLTLST